MPAKSMLANCFEYLGGNNKPYFTTMTLTFQNITHRYGGNLVLDSLTLEAKAGEITCLLGASGSGKSTLLRLAAGLEPLQEGSIDIDGKTVAIPGDEPSPERRPVGLMFQENALFPHKTVGENVGFGLNHLSKEKRRVEVGDLLESVGLAGFGKRYPHTLSGGQQQRVALARSLAPQPKIFLMDEPYASIDAALRKSLGESARQTLKRRNAATILVTHDPNEAMEMADLIAVLDRGKIIQAANPQELYEKPCDPRVAEMFGNAQRVDAVVCKGGFETGYGLIHAEVTGFDLKQTCELVIRPAGLTIARRESSPLKVVDVRFVGSGWIVYLLLESDSVSSSMPLRVYLNDRPDFGEGQGVELTACSKEFFAF